MHQQPVVDHYKHARCFYCQEPCPKSAVTMHHSWIGRVKSRAREAW